MRLVQLQVRQFTKKHAKVLHKMGNDYISLHYCESLKMLNAFKNKVSNSNLTLCPKLSVNLSVFNRRGTCPNPRHSDKLHLMTHEEHGCTFSVPFVWRILSSFKSPYLKTNRKLKSSRSIFMPITFHTLRVCGHNT